MDGDSRLAQLLGVVALAAADRMRGAIEAEVAAGGGAPAALVHLQAHPGGSIEALRRVLGISQPATVRIVDRLADARLLERRAGADRRTLALHLTAAGEAAAGRVLAGRAAPGIGAARRDARARPRGRALDVPAVRPRGVHQRARLPAGAHGVTPLRLASAGIGL